MDCCGDFLFDYQWTAAEIFPLFFLFVSLTPLSVKRDPRKRNVRHFRRPSLNLLPSLFLPLAPPLAVEDEAAQLAAAAALPLRVRAKHKNWKARVAAFEDIATSTAADDEAGPF